MFVSNFVTSLVSIFLKYVPINNEFRNTDHFRVFCFVAINCMICLINYAIIIHTITHILNEMFKMFKM